MIAGDGRLIVMRIRSGDLPRPPRENLGGLRRTPGEDQEEDRGEGGGWVEGQEQGEGRERGRGAAGL